MEHFLIFVLVANKFSAKNFTTSESNSKTESAIRSAVFSPIPGNFLKLSIKLLIVRG